MDIFDMKNDIYFFKDESWFYFFNNWKYFFKIKIYNLNNFLEKINLLFIIFIFNKKHFTIKWLN